MTDQPSIGDKLTYFALITLEKPISLLPTSCMWRFGTVLGRIAHRFAKKRRAIVQANLKIVNPEISDLELTKLSQEVFRKSFGNLASTMNTGCVSSKKIRQLVTINDQERVEGLDNDKGCILLLFHMGNWEITSRTTKLLNTSKPVGAMYRPLNNTLIDEHIKNNRKRDGSQLFGRKKGLIQACKFLKGGGMLAILTDQHSGKAGVTLPLFGKETSITPLPVILAQKYDCPILPVTVKTTAPGKWDLDFEKPFHVPKELDKTEATKLLIPIMEKVMKEHCSDIFWLHDRWKIKGSL